MSVTYLIPGFAGSTLEGPGGNPSPWPATSPAITLQILLGRWNQLLCNPDGSSVLPLTARHLLVDYQLATDTLSAIPCPYDWRMAPAIAAAQVRPLVTGPGWFVCHSYGGHVVLALLAQLAAEGKADWVEGIVFWASPIDYFTSNWTAVQALYGRSAFALAMIRGMTTSQFLLGNKPAVNLAGAAGLSPFSPFVANLINPVKPQLQKLLTSFDSIGVLLPTAANVRQLAYWSQPSVAGVNQAWLDRNLTVRVNEATLLEHLPLGTTRWGVYHTQHLTPVAPVVGPLASQFHTSNAGDSVVSLAERPGGGTGSVGVLDGLTLIPGTHYGCLSDPLVLESIRNVIQSAIAGAPKPTPLPDAQGNRFLTHFQDKPQNGGRIVGVFTTDVTDTGPPFVPAVPGGANGPKPPGSPALPPITLPPAGAPIQIDP